MKALMTRGSGLKTGMKFTCKYCTNHVDLEASLALVASDQIEAITLISMTPPVIVSETLQAWRTVKGGSVILIALLFAGFLKLMQLK